MKFIDMVECLANRAAERGKHARFARIWYVATDAALRFVDHPYYALFLLLVIMPLIGVLLAQAHNRDLGLVLLAGHTCICCRIARRLS